MGWGGGGGGVGKVGVWTAGGGLKDERQKEERRKEGEVGSTQQDHLTLT